MREQERLTGGNVRGQSYVFVESGIAVRRENKRRYKRGLGEGPIVQGQTLILKRDEGYIQYASFGAEAETRGP